jgi:hypothetical protein
VSVGLAISIVALLDLGVVAALTLAVTGARRLRPHHARPAHADARDITVIIKLDRGLGLPA